MKDFAGWLWKPNPVGTACRYSGHWHQSDYIWHVVRYTTLPHKTKQQWHVWVWSLQPRLDKFVKEQFTCDWRSQSETCITTSFRKCIYKYNTCHVCWMGTRELGCNSVRVWISIQQPFTHSMKKQTLGSYTFRGYSYHSRFKYVIYCTSKCAVSSISTSM